MRTTLLATSLLALLAPAAFAQTQPAATRPLSIVDAMRLAQKNSEDVRIAEAALARARAEESRAESARLPQINGSASYQRTIESEFDGLFEPMGPTMGMEVDLPFGRDNTYRIGVNATQELFTGGRITGGIELAEANREQVEVALAEARAQAVLTATEAYYDAVLGRDLLLIAQVTLQQAEETLQQTKLAFEQGAQPEFDVLRAEVTRDNQRTLVVQRASQLELALLRLKQTIGVPLDQPIELTSALTQPAEQDLGTPARQIAGVPEGATAPEAPIDRAEASVRAREASLKLTRSQRWPSLGIGADYGLVNYPEDLFPGFDDWRTNFTVGVSLSVPLFTGGRITSEIRSAEADLLEAEIGLEQTTELSQLSAAQTSEQVQVALAQWKASQRTVEQAERAYEIAQLRYRQGVSTQLELVDSRVLLEQARVNGAQAARDLLVARVELALLPRLPLALGGIPAAAAATAAPTPVPLAVPAAGVQPTGAAAASGGVAPSSGFTF